jgi:hypothetical protein
MSNVAWAVVLFLYGAGFASWILVLAIKDAQRGCDVTAWRSARATLLALFWPILWPVLIGRL